MTDAARSAQTKKRAKKASLAAAIGIVLIGVNLRPAIVAVSPLLGEIRAADGLSATAAGLLTTVPVLCFGVLSPLAPRASRRWGMERTLFFSLLLLCVGFAVRLIPGVFALFAGTVLVGAAIAVGNVLLPGIIKRDFARQTGLMTGLYTMALSGGASLSAGLTIPIQRAAHLDWRYSLAMWGLLVVVAIIVWIPQLRKRHRSNTRIQHISPNLWRSKLAWYVTGFLGLQSLNYYAITAWLPAYFVSAGADAATAGWMLSLASLVGILASLAAAIVAGRMKRQRALGLVVTALIAVGILGLIVAPAGAYLWVICIGLSQGAAISLALALIVLRSPDTAHTSELSGMVQGVGYLVAAIGPIAIGAVHDATLSWTPPFILLLLILIPQAVAAYGAGKDAHVVSR